MKSEWDERFRKAWNAKTVRFDPDEWVARKRAEIVEMGNFSGDPFWKIQSDKDLIEFDKRIEEKKAYALKVADEGESIDYALGHEEYFSELGRHLAVVHAAPWRGKPDFSTDNCWTEEIDGQIVFFLGSPYRKDVTPNDFLHSFQSVGFTLDDGVIHQYSGSNYLDIDDVFSYADPRVGEGADLKQIYDSPEAAVEEMYQTEMGLMY